MKNNLKKMPPGLFAIGILIAWALLVRLLEVILGFIFIGLKFLPNPILGQTLEILLMIISFLLIYYFDSDIRGMLTGPDKRYRNYLIIAVIFLYVMAGLAD